MTSTVSAIKDQVLVPVAPEERVPTLDVLRGFALFGVLWSNLNDWYGTIAPASSLDRSLAWIQQWLVESRFYSLLGFLFGIGFAIQLQRAGARGSDARNIFVRRMLVLLGFGLFHGLFLWSGDILTRYALLGFLLVLYRGLSQKRLAVASALTYLLLTYITPLIFYPLIIATAGPYRHMERQTAPAIYEHGSVAQITVVRIQEFLLHFCTYLLNGWFAGFLTLFLLGMLAARAGLVSKLFAPARQNTTWLRWAFVAALLATAVGVYCQHNFQAWWPVAPSSQLGTLHDLRSWSPRRVFVTLNHEVLIWGSSAAYASALAMLSLRPAGRAILAPLAAVGRMPLTTYLTQSIICTTLFYGYGFHLWGRVGFTGKLEITLVIFSLQMVASVYWLRCYRFGPAEWLWRSLSYGRLQPMRVAMSIAA